MKFLFIQIKQEENVNIAVDFFLELLGKKTNIVRENNGLIIELTSNDNDFNEIANMLNSDLLIPCKVFESRDFTSAQVCHEAILMVKDIDFSSFSNMYFNESDLVINHLGKKELLKKIILGKYHNDYGMQEAIKAFLEANMNVSKAAKDIYMHRNTLIYKIDRFTLETGYDVKKFKEALVIYNLI